MAKVKEKEKDKGKTPAKAVAKPVAKPAAKAAPATAKPAPAVKPPAAKAPAAPAKAPAKPAAKPATGVQQKAAAAAAKPTTDSYRATPASPSAKAQPKTPNKPTTASIKKPTTDVLKTAAAKAASEALKPKAEAKGGKPATDSIKKNAGKPTTGALKSNGEAASAGKNGQSSMKTATKAIEKEKINLSNLKCPIPGDELLKWREMLLQRRAEISGDIAGLVKDAMEAEDGHTTPNHIAERGSDADLQDMSLGMVGEEENILWQIDRAIRKIDKSAPLPYGLCEYTKEPIPKTRLQLIPWTPLSIEGATHLEQNNMTLEDLLLED